MTRAIFVHIEKNLVHINHVHISRISIAKFIKKKNVAPGAEHRKQRFWNKIAHWGREATQWMCFIVVVLRFDCACRLPYLRMELRLRGWWNFKPTPCRMKTNSRRGLKAISFCLFCFVLLCWLVCLFVFNHATLWDVASSKPRPDIGQVITITNPCNIPFERSTSNVRFLCYAFVCK